jgi:hypothetical protein
MPDREIRLNLARTCAPLDDGRGVIERSLIILGQFYGGAVGSDDCSELLAGQLDALTAQRLEHVLHSRAEARQERKRQQQAEEHLSEHSFS